MIKDLSFYVWFIAKIGKIFLMIIATMSTFFYGGLPLWLKILE
jgi:hypothetical protein